MNNVIKNLRSIITNSKMVIIAENLSKIYMNLNVRITDKNITNIIIILDSMWNGAKNTCDNDIAILVKI